ncbi:hypothetical protein RIR_jg4506.t1 [Rhizophagus irregularis DAOM 181602=DAOM 197198]|nr:hypothetical protein RIR_jg4506.t1 [Rhizophagus irregularis DAOM 181602=DAOM 197198]
MHALIVSALRLHLFAAIKSVPLANTLSTGTLYRPDLKFTYGKPSWTKLSGIGRLKNQAWIDKMLHRA